MAARVAIKCPAPSPPIRWRGGRWRDWPTHAVCLSHVGGERTCQWPHVLVHTAPGLAGGAGGGAYLGPQSEQSEPKGHPFSG